MGRIAELYEAPEAAIAAYGKIPRPDKPSSTDTWTLADRRLRALHTPRARK